MSNKAKIGIVLLAVVLMALPLLAEPTGNQAPAAQTSGEATPGNTPSAGGNSQVAGNRDEKPQDILAMRKAAERGEAQAQRNVGIAYLEGKGVPKDEKEAAKWIRKAADQGDAEAERQLANMYFAGSGVPNDGNEAFKWLRKAAQDGSAAAQFALGWKLCFAEGVPQDSAQGMSWIRKAADQGDAASLFVLGMDDYMTGNHAGAVKWFQKSVENGGGKELRWMGGEGPQNRLGMMYETGDGVPKDEVEAVKWYRKGAEVGDERSQYRLGVMYAEGRGGLPKDDVEAVNLYRKSAERGCLDAQYQLGLRYAEGKTVPKDALQAYLWLSFAVQCNETAKDLTTKLTAEMTPQQLTEAQKLVREWKPKQ